MTPALLLAGALVAACPHCDTDNLVPYAMRKSACRSLPYYGITPGCGTPTAGPAFDYRTEFDYPWFHREYQAAAAQAQLQRTGWPTAAELSQRTSPPPRRLPQTASAPRTATRPADQRSPRR